MSAGSVVSTVFLCLLSLAAALLIFWYYAKVSAKNIPILCRVCSIVALFSTILPFPLLVVDINAALDTKADPAVPKETWMIGVWYTIVAVTYIMGWAVLPVSQLYTEVGEFLPRQKIKHAIMKNLKLYVIYLIIIVVLFGYIVFLKRAYGSFASILKLAISLANAWGLILLVLFMSAGLVGVPKMLWRSSDAVRMLRRAYFKAVEIQEDLDIAAMKLAEIKAELMTIYPLVAEEHKVYWTHMMEEIDAADRDIPKYHAASARVKPMTGDHHTDVSLQHLEALHERVKYSIKIALRMNHLWDTTLRDCQSYDELIRGVKTSNNPLKRCWFPVRGIFYKVAAACTCVLTLLVLWSEIVLPFQPLTNKQLSVIALAMRSDFQLVGSMMFMFYMAYCSYWAILQLKVFDIYVMLSGIADNASMCFSVIFLSRLIMPLGFNFLLISGLVADDIDVMYGHVYRRNMDVSLVLGTWLNQFIPLFIPFVAALVLLKLTGRLLVIAGVEMHDPDDVMSNTVLQRIEDGYRLVSHALGQSLTVLDLGSLGISSKGSASVHVAAAASAGKTRPPERGERYREYLARKQAREEKEPT
ncbi:putative LMBR1-like membrane protein [Trypanosoma rangeli]|uniref:Putative LMBR1-like membrane protein n=1 Tax=Trypanosoma rangeli TaxID=5698 RepID=A0A422NIP4_TRYRA|nr:putative LMBR1-like membrane protein [Trypanosoma rangeli]RNF05264.1 putative LMBR1-like membrane protein [Trypanosoma rangeli]|eukprot:RNF05264.1 putative LMBR1-like membrane protein [Trypanosoma rangeli]